MTPPAAHTQKLSNIFDALGIAGIFKAVTLPETIVVNLAPQISLRPYQEEALKRFLYFMDSYPQRPNPTHALFHMATGSGKTIIMAALILDLYRRGYRNFMFFVNSTNIIDKTKANFLDAESSKYFFAPKIKFGAKEIRIRQVSNFDEAVEDDINIHFTTIQGLHTRLNTPSENSVTYEDFEGRKIALLSDEAHHINTLTKKQDKLSKDEEEEKTSWEHTVQRVFKSHPENIMLEFSATVETDHLAIAAKYHDKILYEYSLRAFRQDGYSKDVDVLQADMKPLDRAFQAVILSQYRRKIAEKHGLHIKPVMLMKSKTIAESGEIENQFYEYIDKLTAKEILRVAKNSSGIVETAFKFFLQERKIDPDDLIRELQGDFAREKCRSVNSKKNSEDMQIELNTLEGRDNEIRLIFVVDMLNEGWDVLNLFDIVRLYDKRDSKAGKPGKTTVAEAQLIGRGARYCPFIAPDKPDLPRDQRKYDEDTGNELKILEELYYHCAHNPDYIKEIKRALRDTGILADTTREVRMKVKDSFKKTDFFNKDVVFINKKVENKRENIFELKDYFAKEKTYFKYPHLMTGKTRFENLLDGEDGKDSSAQKPVSKVFQLKELPKAILRRAIDGLEFFRFESIQKYFPKLEAIKYFIEMDKFLASVKVEISGLPIHLDNLDPKSRLEIVLHVLKEIETEIKGASSDYQGTKEFYPKAISEIVQDKSLKFSIDPNSDKETGKSWKDSSIAGLKHIDLFTLQWFVYEDNFGTSEEKHLIKYISDNAERIEQRYDEFYLIRNEGDVRLYNFDDGRAVEPDFLLCAREKGEKTSCTYQVFMEPKGGHLLTSENEAWKQDFLLAIEGHAKTAVSEIHGSKYVLMGMPFFNEDQTKGEFSGAFEEKLRIGKKAIKKTK